MKNERLLFSIYEKRRKCMLPKKQYVQIKIRRYEKENGCLCNYIDRKICSECGGQCCKSTPCSLMPCDVKDMSVGGIKRMLDSEKYSLRLILSGTEEKPHYTICMSARMQGTNRIRNNLLYSPCALLGENGCTLSDEERPTCALLTIPGPNQNCKMLVSPKEYIDAWDKYAGILEEVWKSETSITPEEYFLIMSAKAYFEIQEMINRGVVLNEEEEMVFQRSLMLLLRAKSKI